MKIFETRIITIQKDLLDNSSYASTRFFDWCKKNKIKVEEPLNTKTKLYSTFVITLDTLNKHLAFSAKWLPSIKLGEPIK